ncbi:MAG: PQQ-dependent sugar dehydrogenase [Pseudomonadota bacterium]
MIWKILIWIVVSIGVLVGLGAALVGYFLSNPVDNFSAVYVENCGACHGESLEGTQIGPALIGRDLVHGESVAELVHSISNGFPERGMPPWSKNFDDGTIESLAIYVAEKRADQDFTDFKNDQPLELPTDVVRSEYYDFRVELVAEGIHHLPFSIQPLPDGRILLVEKTQGIRIIERDGSLSDLITGAPQAYEASIDVGIELMGIGWLMDIALHPDYENNGWVYLHYGDRCEECEGIMPISMNRVVRARIEDGQWVDEQDVWKVDESFYTSMTDMAAGGRICFDDAGYLYISIGMKGASNHHGIQDMTTPYGKIHRVHDDGRVPLDNPFLAQAGAWQSAWTFGHRSPQGLEIDPRTGALWGTEMGPRGGDELNLLAPGRNFGWPLTSKGVDYDGSPVEYGKDLGIEFDIEDIEQPKIDFTPSPAISSFVFYDGAPFADWGHNLLIGSLRATELYRVVTDGERIIERETILEDFARIRDIEIGFDGLPYLLLEHNLGSYVVRLVPVARHHTEQNTAEQNTASLGAEPGEIEHG